MKKVFSLLTAAAFVFLAASCGGGNSPASIEKSIHAQMQKGNYKKAVEMMFDNMDGLKEEPTEEQMAAFVGKVEASDKEHGGIKSFEIVSEDISEDGLTAEVTSKIVYGNGKEDTQTTKYVKKDGKWKMSMGK
jgi:hypothetical protein